MSDMEHTPRPFSFNDDGLLKANDGVGFGQVWGETPERQERAAFIVRACNAHDELLKACQMAYDLFESVTDFGKAGTAAMKCDAMLKAAISAAKGGA